MRDPTTRPKPSWRKPTKAPKMRADPDMTDPDATSVTPVVVENPGKKARGRISRAIVHSRAEVWYSLEQDSCVIRTGMQQGLVRIWEARRVLVRLFVSACGHWLRACACVLSPCISASLRVCVLLVVSVCFASLRVCVPLSRLSRTREEVDERSKCDGEVARGLRQDVGVHQP
eukprot:512201-Rhodomonas_salina.3